MEFSLSLANPISSCFMIDGWQLNIIQKNKDNLFTIICNVPDDLITPDEMLTGKHFYYQDLWNHYIFGEIIKYRKEIDYSTTNINYENLNHKLNKN